MKKKKQTNPKLVFAWDEKRGTFSVEELYFFNYSVINNHFKCFQLQIR